MNMSESKFRNRSVLFKKEECNEQILFDKNQNVRKLNDLGIKRINTIAQTKSILKQSNNSSLNVSLTSNNQSVQSSVYLDKSVFQSDNIDKITKLHKYY